MNLYNVNVLINGEPQNFNLKATDAPSALNYLFEKFKDAELISFILVKKEESQIIKITKA